MPEQITIADWIIRLTLAAFFSGFIGFEREHRQKAAGLRTHMLVGLGAALFTLLSGTAFEDGDPSRIAAQIVTGVGFLGAGAIFREGSTVRGLTTAAGLWAVAAIGTTSGAGFLIGAAIATAIVFVILVGLRIVEDVLRDRRAIGRMRPVGVRLRDLSQLAELIKVIRSLDPTADQVKLQALEHGRYQATLDIHQERLQTVIAGITGLDTVLEAMEIDPGT